MGVTRIKELAEMVAAKHDMPKAKAQELIKGLFEDIKESVGEGGKVAIGNFGTLTLKVRKPRKARNPRTGDMIFVPGKNAVRFSPSKAFKEYLQVAGRNVLLFTKDKGNFKDYLADNIKGIQCNPKVASTVEEAFKFIFEDDIEIFSILIDNTVPQEEVKMVCNRIKMDESGGILSLIRIKSEGFVDDLTLMEILPDEAVQEPFQVDQLMGLITDEVNRIQDERGYFSQQLRLRVPTIIGEIEKTYELMDDLLKKTNLEEDQIDELGNAYREAVGNASHHGNNDDEAKSIFIDFVVDQKKVSLSIEDQGEGFDASPFTRRAEKSAALDVARARNRLENPGGMGMMIITKCTDEVYFNKRGTKITLVKHLNL